MNKKECKNCVFKAQWPLSCVAIAWFVFKSWHSMNCYQQIEKNVFGEIVPFGHCLLVWFALDVSAALIIGYNMIVDMFCVPNDPRKLNRGSRGTGFLVYLWMALFVGFNIAAFVILGLSPNKFDRINKISSFALNIRFQFISAVVIFCICIVYIFLAALSTCILNRRAAKALKHKH